MIRRFPPTAPPPNATIPSWLRRAVSDPQSPGSQGFEDLAVAAGAAIGALDSLVRRQERWAGAWRQRLALAAAVVTAKRAGRIEDERQLRDAILLTRPGDAVGPAGSLLVAWRQLASKPADKLLTRTSLATALEAFGFAPDEETIGELEEALGEVLASQGSVGALLGALTIAQTHGFGRGFGAWLADALLAQRLGWDPAVPLLGTEASLAITPARARAPAMETGAVTDTAGERIQHLMTAQARAALRAIDLFAELERRAEKLLEVAPKLRAKGADRVVERLLSEDAIVASGPIAGMSDRGMRRLFDRLVSFGAVRELSGRATFRIYGLCVARQSGREARVNLDENPVSRRW